MNNDEQMHIRKKIFNASLASIVISIGLIVLGKMAQNHGDLIMALILMFTSNFVMLAYLFGVRRYFKVLGRQEKK